MQEQREGAAVTRGSGDPQGRRADPVLPQIEARREPQTTGWSPTAWRNPKEQR